MRWSIGFGSLIAFAASARAEPPGFELDYVAASECVSAPGFRALVQRQLVDYDPNLVANTHARVLARIAHSEHGYLARFELTRDDGSRSSRELSVATCQEAAPALAFILAMALGGRSVESEASPKTALAVSPPPARAAAPPVASTNPREPKAPLLTPARLRGGLGIELGARGGLGQALTSTESAFGELERKDVAWLWQSRLALIRDQPVTRADQRGALRLSWLAVRLAECPYALAFGSAVRLLPCVVGHVGQMTARGDPAPAPAAMGRQASKPWVDAGLGLRLELRLLGPLSVQLQAEVLAPITRYHFEFTPALPLYAVPGLAGGGSVGLGVRFP